MIIDDPSDFFKTRKAFKETVCFFVGVETTLIDLKKGVFL